MTTTQETPTIDRLLRSKRNGGPKAKAIRAIGCSRPMYDAWEGGVYVPSDDFAVAIAEYLGETIERVVWILYQSRLAKNRVSILPNNPILAVAA